MNKLTLLFGVLICLVAVNARHFADRSEDEPSENEETLRRKDHFVSRHRRRRWQANYGYDYQPPSYYPDRRDYDRNQEVISNIYRLLEDIAAHLRRTPPPPPPPQPIFIPYPVPYPISTGAACKTPQKIKPVVNVTSRFPDMEDTNQNWGFVVADEDDSGDDNDGARPISFEPLAPKQFMSRPAPNVEHGSQQGDFSTVAPKFLKAPSAAFADSPSAPVPGMCSAAILSCCGFSTDKAQQEQCFGNVGCSSSFSDGSACSPVSIQQALESFRKAYSPM